MTIRETVARMAAEKSEELAVRGVRGILDGPLVSSLRRGMALLLWLALLSGYVLLGGNQMRDTVFMTVLPMAGLLAAPYWGVLLGFFWGRVMLCLLLAMHAVFFLGGWNLYPGSGPGDLLLEGLTQLLGSLGMCGLMLALLDRPVWRILRWAFLGIAVISLLGSLVFYLGRFEGSVDFGYTERFFRADRLFLLVPTRLWFPSEAGVFWEHCNNAGFFFAVLCGVGLLLAKERRGSWKEWLWLALAFVSLVTMHLTVSRGAHVVLLGILLVTVVRTDWRWMTRVVLLALVAISVGRGLYAYKLGALKESGVAVSNNASSGMVGRADAGRFAVYKAIIDEVGERWLVGRGLYAAPSKVLQLPYEHSTIMAVFRSAGVLGLCAYLAMYAVAAWRALWLWRLDVRWPLVLVLAAFLGTMVDRTTPFVVLANYENLAFWAAIALPLLAASRERAEERGPVPTQA